MRVEGLANDTDARIERLELVNGSRMQAFLPHRAYHRIAWLNDDRFALFSDGYSPANDMPDAMEGFPPALIVDPQCARAGQCPAIESYRDMKPLDSNGSFLGVRALGDCYRIDGAAQLATGL